LKRTARATNSEDAQDGGDHVDAHRSPVLVISPHVRRGFISHRHTSMPSVQKTIYELLGLGPLNLEDALASDMSDMFVDRPDLALFSPLPSDPRVFDSRRPRYSYISHSADILQPDEQKQRLSQREQVWRIYFA
jgi:hypothetical protein